MCSMWTMIAATPICIATLILTNHTNTHSLKDIHFIAMHSPFLALLLADPLRTSFHVTPIRTLFSQASGL